MSPLFHSGLDVTVKYRVGKLSSLYKHMLWPCLVFQIAIRLFASAASDKICPARLQRSLALSFQPELAGHPPHKACHAKTTNIDGLDAVLLLARTFLLQSGILQGTLKTSLGEISDEDQTEPWLPFMLALTSCIGACQKEQSQVDL